MMISEKNSAVGYEKGYVNIVQGKAEPMAIPAENLVRIFKLERISTPPSGQNSALDFGCGEGRHTQYLSELGYQVLATDVSQGAIEATRLRMKNKPVETVLLDLKGDRLPLEDSSVSMVLAWEVLHWLGSKQMFLHYLKEFQRIIQKGRKGHLIFTMPTETHYLKLKAIEIGESQYRCLAKDRPDFVMYSPNLVTLKAMLHDHGFEILRVKNYSLGDDKEEERDLDHPFAMYSFCCVHP